MDQGDRLSPDEAKQRILKIIREGVVSFSAHAFQEMKKDRIETTDIVNVLRGGWVEEAEWENREWRHRVHTQKFCVVVSFPIENEVRVITAWRER